MMKSDWVYRRGDLYLANLGVPEGSRQGGVRPIVVLQNDVGNYFAPTITLAPLTSKIEKKKQQPTHYLLRRAKGLQRPSTVLAEQLGTFDKANIIGCIETYEADPAFTASAPEKRCYTVDELQIILACGRETVYSLLKKNEFRWFRVGGGNGVYRISKKSFDEWLDARI